MSFSETFPSSTSNPLPPAPPPCTLILNFNLNRIRVIVLRPRAAMDAEDYDRPELPALSGSTPLLKDDQARIK